MNTPNTACRKSIVESRVQEAGAVRSSTYSLAPCLILCVLAFLRLCVNALALTPVVYQSTDFTGGTNNLPVTLTSVLKIQVGQQYLLAGLPIYLYPTNGTVATNLNTGLYNLAIQGVAKGVTVYVPDTNVTQNLALCVISNMATFSAANLGVVITNQLTMIGGTNITITTNGFSFTVNASVTNIPFGAITNPPTTLAGYGITDALRNANNLSDVTSASAARGNLGLGSAATNSANGFIGSNGGIGTNNTLVGNGGEFLLFGNGGNGIFHIQNTNASAYSGFPIWDDKANERGALTYCNSNSTYALASPDKGNDGAGGINLIESFGLQRGFYFGAGGTIFHGMASSSGDWVSYDSNTNVTFRIVRAVGGDAYFTNNIHVGKLVYAGSGAGGQITKLNGTLNNGAFDGADTSPVSFNSAKLTATNFAAQTRNAFNSGNPISFDAGANGSGLNYETQSGQGVIASGLGSSYVTTETVNGWLTGPTFVVGGSELNDIHNWGNAVLEVHGCLGTTNITKTSSYTLGFLDSVVLLNGTTLSATLPDATAHCKGRIYTIKLISSSTATVATTSAQHIDGGTSFSLSAQYKYVSVQSDGTQWWIIANN